MRLHFEVGASVLLVGKDLQFAGLADKTRIRVLVSKDALRRLFGAADLTPQETFRVFDRNRERLQDIARRLYESAPAGTKTLKIGAADI